MSISLIPSRPCTYPGCTNFATHGRCDLHIKQSKRKYDVQRENSEEWRIWIHSTRYRKAIEMFKSDHPLCERCEKKGTITPVYIVHHKTPHEGNYDLFWDSENNWESVCNNCHEEIHKKTRFGRGKGNNGDNCYGQR